MIDALRAVVQEPSGDGPVAHLPSSHPYVVHLAPTGPDEAVASVGTWTTWPRSGASVVHVHFGFEHLTGGSSRHGAVSCAGASDSSTPPTTSTTRTWSTRRATTARCDCPGRRPRRDADAVGGRRHRAAHRRRRPRRPASPRRPGRVRRRSRGAPPRRVRARGDVRPNLDLDLTGAGGRPAADFDGARIHVLPSLTPPARRTRPPRQHDGVTLDIGPRLDDDELWTGSGRPRAPAAVPVGLALRVAGGGPRPRDAGGGARRRGGFGDQGAVDIDCRVLSAGAAPRWPLAPSPTPDARRRAAVRRQPRPTSGGTAASTARLAQHEVASCGTCTIRAQAMSHGRGPCCPPSIAKVVAVGPHRSASAPPAAVPGRRPARGRPPPPMPDHRSVASRAGRTRPPGAPSPWSSAWHASTARPRSSTSPSRWWRWPGCSACASWRCARVVGEATCPTGSLTTRPTSCWIPAPPRLDPTPARSTTAGGSRALQPLRHQLHRPTARGFDGCATLVVLLVGTGGTASSWLRGGSRPRAGWDVVIAGLADCWSRGGERALDGLTTIESCSGGGRRGRQRWLGQRRRYGGDRRSVGRRPRASTVRRAGGAGRCPRRRRSGAASRAWPTPAALGDVLTDAMSARPQPRGRPSTTATARRAAQRWSRRCIVVTTGVVVIAAGRDEHVRRTPRRRGSSNAAARDGAGRSGGVAAVARRRLERRRRWSRRRGAPGRLPLGGGRNLGAASRPGDVVFLDADCIAAPDLVARYEQVLRATRLSWPAARSATCDGGGRPGSASVSTSRGWSRA